MTILPQLRADGTVLQPALVDGAAVSAASAKTRERLSLAFHWFLRAREEAAGSTDRFLCLYLALEAAIKAATEDKVSAEQQGQFAALRQLVERHNKALGPFVERLQNRLLQPFIADRFRGVAVRYYPEQAEADCALFRRLGQLRGGLVHAAARALAGKAAGESPDSELERLTLR